MRSSTLILRSARAATCAVSSVRLMTASSACSTLQAVSPVNGSSIVCFVMMGAEDSTRAPRTCFERWLRAIRRGSAPNPRLLRDDGDRPCALALLDPLVEEALRPDRADG